MKGENMTSQKLYRFSEAIVVGIIHDPIKCLPLMDLLLGFRHFKFEAQLKKFNLFDLSSLQFLTKSNPLCTKFSVVVPNPFLVDSEILKGI